jgi:hypothetical protein
MHIAAKGQRCFPCTAAIRTATSSFDHRYLIGAFDDLLMQRLDSNGLPQLVKRRSKQFTEFRTHCRRMVFMQLR